MNKGKFLASSAVLAVYSWCASAAEPGTVLWSLNTGIYSPPALGQDGTIYVVSDNGLCAITNNGVMASNKWCVPLSGRGSPAVGSDGIIYIEAEDGKLHAINPDGSERWAYTTQTGGGAPALGWDGTAYVDAYIYLHTV